MEGTAPDLVFSGRWVAKGTIGKGAFSEIYVAQDKTSQSGDLVAIKFQNSEFDSSVMKWESMVMQDLSQIASVPRMIHYGHDIGRDYMVMELLTGEDMASLRDRVRISSDSGLMPIEVASFLTRQMIASLRAMHDRGYVHRDVKPSNFVRRSPSSTEFCVIDFGLAKQHRDAQGQIRTERDTADFRGTTVYASPFVHSGHDQCPRDDLFSAIHVFLDLVLGDLPWRTQAKAKDKAAVGALKMELMQNPDSFLDEVVRSFEASNASQGSEMRAAVERVRGCVVTCITHLRTLKYLDTPNYDLLLDTLKSVSEKSDAEVGALNYESGAFNWHSGSTLDDRIARFSACTAVNGGGKARPRKSTDRPPTEEIDNQFTSAAGVSHHTSSSSAAKPIMKLINQGTKEDYRLQNVLEKLLAMQKEVRAHQEARARAAAAPSSGGSTVTATAASVDLSVGVRWKLLARELTRLPEQLVASAPAVEATAVCLAVLVQCDHFFHCNLGELDKAWQEFLEIQLVAGPFYDFVRTVRSKTEAAKRAAADAGERSSLEATNSAIDAALEAVASEADAAALRADEGQAGDVIVEGGGGMEVEEGKAGAGSDSVGARSGPEQPTAAVPQVGEMSGAVAEGGEGSGEQDSKRQRTE